MAHTSYSNLAFIAPSSNADLTLLKNNLEAFYNRPVIKTKPEIVCDHHKITITFNDGYRLYIVFNDDEYVNTEAKEMADIFALDWNDNSFDKEKLKTCNKRFEVWGDSDFDMEYFNDSLFVLEEIEQFHDVVIFTM